MNRRFGGGGGVMSVSRYLGDVGGLRVSQARREQSGHEAAGVACGNRVTGTRSSFLQKAQGLV